MNSDRSELRKAARRPLARRVLERGFTIIEILVVVTIIGLLAGVAAVQVKNTMMRSKMSILKNDLRVMRDLIQQYKVDRKVYPEGIDTLIERGYLRTRPIDPIADSDQWEEIMNEPDLEEDPETADTGMVDVRSVATGSDLDGVPFAEY